VALFYADASVARHEAQSDALGAFTGDADLVSSEPAPTEAPVDAIHITAAADVAPIDAFVTYDERQSAAARLAGLRTVAPA
jgi:predicted nucleic acid-binding protein